MIRNIFIVSIFIILYEGFYLLPEKMVVLPGVFRVSDVFLLLLPLFFLFFFPSILRSCALYAEESRLVLAITALVLLGPLMAMFFFGQPYLTGLLFIRHNLEWLSFFMFALLLGNLKGVERALKTLTILIGIWVVILFMTKYFPTMGIINFRKGYYAAKGFMRFGDSRLFLPYGTVPVYLFCIMLARRIFPDDDENISRKLVEWTFVLLVFYAVVSTYTRILIIPLLVISLYALLTCKRPFLRYVGIFLIFITVSLQAMNMAAGWEGGVIEESKLGKIFLGSDKLAKESGRRFQSAVCIDNFLKSPLTGVGNLASGKLDYEKNFHMRTYKQFGFYSVGDIGYLKMAAENGLLGIVWIAWFYWYIYRRSGWLMKAPESKGVNSIASTVGRGSRYFLIYLLISGVTIPHFITTDGIPAIAFALAILAVTSNAMRQERAVADCAVA